MITCIPNVLDRQGLEKVKAMIARMPFVDGGTTAKGRAKDRKQNEQIRKDPALGAQELDRFLIEALHASEAFQVAAFPRHVLPPTISRYRPGMQYGLHADNAFVGGIHSRMRSDLSVTIFLNDPESYDGGELIIAAGAGQEEVKLMAGEAVVYPSSSLHRVSPVTRGERLAAITWVQSYVRGTEQRELLADLRTMSKRLNEIDADSHAADVGVKAYYNLLRMWSDG